MVRVFGGGDKGEPLDMAQYKKDVIANQGTLCPVTLEPVDPDEGQVIFNLSKEWFISTLGLKLLRDMFGDVYINSKIVHGAKKKGKTLTLDIG